MKSSGPGRQQQEPIFYSSFDWKLGYKYESLEGLIGLLALLV